MMKKYWVIIVLVSVAALMESCNKVRRNPGRVYMPDMAYSRAYETYASREGLNEKGINYSAMPVPGTIARGDMFSYTIKNDSAGYVASKSVVNPLPALDAKQYLEAARLYLIYCGICHGTKLDGNGPLYNDGKGPYAAAPKNLMLEDAKALSPGTMFHVVTYGNGQMGSYASQLSTEQRWQIIHYIKEKQLMGAAGATPASGSDSTVAPVKDSTVAKIK